MKPMRLLWASLIGVVVLCVGGFAWLTSYMSHQNEKTVSEVAELCLEQTGTQIQLHFDTAMELFETQLEGISTHVTAQEADGSSAETGAAIAEYAADTKFSFVELYAQDGTATTPYGTSATLDDEDEGVFLHKAANGSTAIASATDAEGNPLVVIGVAAELPMSTGDTSVVIAAGLPASEINQELSLTVGTTQIYSHIIRTDGSFVIRNKDFDATNYYDVVESEVPDDEDAQSVVANLRIALESGSTDSLVLDVEGTMSNVYFAPLDNTDWYLVATLPQSIIANPVHGLVNQRFYSTLACCGLVLAAILIAFGLYFRMARRQMKAVEEARREADAANRAKSVFLSNMSHDIRTPMNAIVGLAEVASNSPGDSALIQDCLRKIRLSSKHLLGLINDVLDMSKIESGKLSLNPSLVSLRETAENIVGIIQPQVKARGLKFDVFINSISDENVYCDGVRLNQVLLNLLSNALKFTPEGGSVSLDIEQASSGKGDKQVRTVFRVRDTGVGMAPEFKERIFDSFERESTELVRRTEGTGLGMAIVKSIVDKMEGTIDVESELGVGSVFTVTLDLERAAETDNGLTLPEWDILIVDDDEQTCKAAAAALEELGPHAEWTTSGTRAIELVEARRTRGSDYHAALIDWKMPGLDGVECARRIRQHIDGDVPILLISAYDWTEVEDEARKAGVSGFISKPLFKSTLYCSLHRLEGDLAETAAANAEKKIDLGGARVLLAEDQELNWEVARALLEPYNLELEWAKNGQEAVRLFAESPEGRYDAVLMDVQMPVMDGYEATRAIRALDRSDAGSVPIVAMTANVFSQDIEDSLSCGMNAHTSKPIDGKSLARLLADLLGSE